MATYFDLDSILRDRTQYPNPANYVVGPEQIKTWYRDSRSVRVFPQNPNTQPREFATSVKLVYLSIPYDPQTIILPRVYVQFQSKEYLDKHLIQTIDGVHADEQFICVFDKVQVDDTSTPIWIHYKCQMEQVTRFRRDDVINFKVTTRSGAVLPNLDTLLPADPDPTKQVLATFEVLPYIRDADYDNHLVEPLS